MAEITMRQMLEAGVHFGHQTRRWNPKMRPYIFSERNGIHIIDLRQTLEAAGRAADFVRDITAKGGTVLFIGTKKQAQGVVVEAAERAEMPYVNHRWLGGMLTNFNTIHRRILYMLELERMDATGEMDSLPKKERLKLRREKEKLVTTLGGVRDMHKTPDAVFIIDVNAEAIAVREASRLGAQIIALVDTNCDPDSIDMVIPGNDDAIRSAQLMAMLIAEACREGAELAKAKASKQEAEKKEGAEGADQEDESGE
ncbi:MAG: 30S ribosomal protein S2 [Acidimicrobiia bacterium]|nr:30S ribosomal protein S2 [Acidimicrobiia bacterium]